MDLISTFILVVVVIVCWVGVLTFMYMWQHKRAIRRSSRGVIPIAPKLTDDEARLARIHEAETMPQRILEG